MIPCPKIDPLHRTGKHFGAENAAYRKQNKCVYFGWITADNRVDNGDDLWVVAECKARLSDTYGLHAKEKPENYRRYAILAECLPPLDTERMATYVNWWEDGFKVPHTTVEATDNPHVAVVTPDAAWCYGPAGVITHAWMLRSSLLWPGSPDPLTWWETSPPSAKYSANIHRLAYNDVNDWKRGKTTLKKCLEEKQLPFTQYGWGTPRLSTHFADFATLTEAPTPTSKGAYSNAWSGK